MKYGIWNYRLPPPQPQGRADLIGGNPMIIRRDTFGNPGQQHPRANINLVRIAVRSLPLLHYRCSAPLKPLN
jgi:hypothetical protein